MRESFLIFCEGPTEVGYFSSFRKKAKPVSGGNALAVVQNAIAYKNASDRRYDQYWVVFDKDDTIEQHFEEAIRLAIKNDIRPAWSNQAFELWFILHYRDFRHACHRNQYEAVLRQYIPTYSANDKGEDQGRALYQCTIQRVQSAIDNALNGFESFESDGSPAQKESCTKVYELINSIRQNL